MSQKDRQKINTLIYQLFNTTGSFTNVKQLDRLNILAGQLSDEIRRQARSESVELMRKLQKAITEGFKKTFAAHESLEKRVKELEGKMNDNMSNGSTKRTNRKTVREDTGTSNTD